VNPVVSVVVVSYETRELILTALATLRTACPAEPYEVIVVDNASTDDSAAAVAAEFPEARVVRLADNVGFGRAVNVGAARARGDWLLLLNPDTEPVGNVIGELLAFTRTHPGHGIYAGRTLRMDGTDDGLSVFGAPSLWTLTCFATGLTKMFPRSRLFNRERLPWLDRSTPVRVPAASGCLLLVRRSLFAQLDGFTPDYFMYNEDLDLCLRATALGASPMLVPTARVVHVGGAASTSAGKRVMLLRGQVTFLRLRWSPTRAAAGRALLLVGIAVRAVGARLTGRAGYWREVWRQRHAWLTGWPPAGGLPPIELTEPVPPSPRGTPRPSADNH
jgi:hypothetical protein